MIGSVCELRSRVHTDSHARGVQEIQQNCCAHKGGAEKILAMVHRVYVYMTTCYWYLLLYYVR